MDHLPEYVVRVSPPPGQPHHFAAGLLVVNEEELDRRARPDIVAGGFARLVTLAPPTTPEE